MSTPVRIHAGEALLTLPGVGALLVWGTGAPTASAAGYAIGCLYIRIDDATTALYCNKGTATVADWKAVTTA